MWHIKDPLPDLAPGVQIPGHFLTSNPVGRKHSTVERGDLTLKSATVEHYLKMRRLEEQLRLL